MEGCLTPWCQTTSAPRDGEQSFDDALETDPDAGKSVSRMLLE